MAQTGFTPIQLYSSSTPTNAPAAGNLTNDTKGSELAVNIADGKLFYKDTSNNVQTIADKTWIGTVTNVSALTIGTTGTDLSSTVANPTSTPVITLNVPTASATNRGALSSTDWSTFNNKQAALVSGTNIKTVNGTTLLGSGDLGTIGVAYGGTGASSASITAFNNITGYTASGATGTTSTNIVFSTSPTLTTPKATTTIGVGNATPSASGAGITFPATASASSDANTLDDYEEGTWTPTLIGTTTNPTVTYNLQRGLYTKVGRTVTISVYMAWSAISGGSGNIAVGNFPFTIESTPGTYGGGAVAYFDGFTFTAGRTSVGLWPQSGLTYATPTCFGSAVTTQLITVASVAASGTISLTLTYSV